MLFHSLHLLIRSDSEKLSWPNSPLLVLLHFVDPNVLSRDDDIALHEGETRAPPLHMLAALADPSDYTTHEKQLILAKQLIERGAKVKGVTNPQGRTPLHAACSGSNVTNLDFIELLLKAGADPNAQDYMETTPLMLTIPYAPGAAKFLLNWPTTNVHITNRSGLSFLLELLRMNIKGCSDQIALPDIPDRVRPQFLLDQLRQIEEMVVERGP
jgi:hypothetical protein